VTAFFLLFRSFQEFSPSPFIPVFSGAFRPFIFVFISVFSGGSSALLLSLFQGI
jgi:hypothetical protein